MLGGVGLSEGPLSGTQTLIYFQRARTLHATTSSPFLLKLREQPFVCARCQASCGGLGELYDLVQGISARIMFAIVESISQTLTVKCRTDGSADSIKPGQWKEQTGTLALPLTRFVR